MSTNLESKLGTGLKPQQFIEGMTKNKEKFVEWSDAFVWENEEDKEFFQSLNNRDDLRCLALIADWCGDVIRNVPVVFRALEISGIPTEVLIKEEHPDVMEQFLTGDGEAIPITRQEMDRQYGEGIGYQTVIVKELHDLISSF